MENPLYMAESQELDDEKPAAWLELIEDKELKRDFQYIYREFRLGNLTKYEAEIVHNLLASALQLYLYQKEYERKGVQLRLEDTVKMILADALSIVTISRSRGGFERRMQTTTIQKVEQREIEEKKSRLSLFGLRGDRT